MLVNLYFPLKDSKKNVSSFNKVSLMYKNFIKTKSCKLFSNFATTLKPISNMKNDGSRNKPHYKYSHVLFCYGFVCCNTENLSTEGKLNS